MSKIKRIIEIDESFYNLLKERELTVDQNAMLNASKRDMETASAVLDMVDCLKLSQPYDDSDDCISRKYVEGKIEELENICQNAPDTVLELLSDIKNAPPVNVQKIENKAYNEGFKDGVDQGIKLSSGSKDRTITDADCMDEDAKQASIPYTYNAPQHDWKCGYPNITGGKEE